MGGANLLFGKHFAEKYTKMKEISQYRTRFVHLLLSTIDGSDIWERKGFCWRMSIFRRLLSEWISHETTREQRLSQSRKGLKLSVTESQSDKCESLMSASEPQISALSSTILCIYRGRKGYTSKAKIYTILKNYYTATLSSAIIISQKREIK